MVNKNQLINGVVKYMDAELLPKTQGAKFWAMTALGTLASKQAAQMLDKLAEVPALKTLALVDNSGNIDIDSLYNAVRPAAEKQPASVDIPLIGRFTFGADDVDKLYNYINS